MKYLSLILLLLFITIVTSFNSCCCNREGYDKDAMIAGGYVNVGSRPGNCAPTIIPGNNNFTSRELASQFCFDWNQKGGTPACTAIEQGGTTWFYKKPDKSPAPPPPFHPPAPPPHAPWNINTHISHIQNPIMGHGDFNDPLPSIGATFIKRENSNISLNPAPAPNQ
jgi:hypothetical protein